MLKLQYYGHLMRRDNSFEKTLMLGKIKGRSRRGRLRIKWLDSITDSIDTNLSKLRVTEEDRGVWCAESTGSQRVRHDLATKQQRFQVFFGTIHKNLSLIHSECVFSH